MNESFAHQEVSAAGNFEFYDKLLGEINTLQPHRQGMSEEELHDALSNPDVIKTRIDEPTGESYLVPQLSPIEQFEWLNSDFYENRFPKETTEKTILHFSDFADIEPGPDVASKIQELADKNGVLVFDYPAGTDPAYEERIKSRLTKMNVQIGEVEQLGMQTYFAGQSRIERPHETREQPLGLIPSFRQMVDSGEYDSKRLDNGASLMESISPNEASHMDEFYKRAFQVLNDDPCKQGLDPDEFHKIVTEDEQIAKLVNTRNGQITALCILGEDLEKFNWINNEYYEHAFPEKADKKQIVYFPALAADPEQAGSNTETMLELLAELVEAGDNEILVAFDCCEKNTGFLDQALEKMINALPQVSIRFQPIAAQKYGAIRLSR